MLEPRLVKLAAPVANVVVLDVLCLDHDQGRLLGPQRPPTGLPCAQLGLHGHLGRIGEIHVVFVCWSPTVKVSSSYPVQ